MTKMKEKRSRTDGTKPDFWKCEEEKRIARKIKLKSGKKQRSEKSAESRDLIADVMIWRRIILIWIWTLLHLQSTVVRKVMTVIYMWPVYCQLYLDSDTLISVQGHRTKQTQHIECISTIKYAAAHESQV